VVFAKDVARLRTFYRDGLGLPIVTDEPDWVQFDAGGVLLAVHAIPPAIAATIVIEEPAPVIRSSTALKPVFFVADATVASDRVADHGGFVLQVPSATTVRCMDPEGNVFDVTVGA
jgi:predicted enzyme related to lactoylglutathione lyase